MIEKSRRICLLVSRATVSKYGKKNREESVYLSQERQYPNMEKDGEKNLTDLGLLVSSQNVLKNEKNGGKADPALPVLIERLSAENRIQC